MSKLVIFAGNANPELASSMAEQINIPLGDADVGGLISIVVDNGEPTRVDVGGKPLRPGDVLEAELTDEYVQRRATVTIEVFGAAGMLERGFLSAAGIYPMLAHEDRHVDSFLEAAEPIMAELAEAIRADDIEQRIGGQEKRSGFHRLA